MFQENGSHKRKHNKSCAACSPNDKQFHVDIYIYTYYLFEQIKKRTRKKERKKERNKTCTCLLWWVTTSQSQHLMRKTVLCQEDFPEIATPQHLWRIRFQMPCSGHLSVRTPYYKLAGTITIENLYFLMVYFCPDSSRFTLRNWKSFSLMWLLVLSELLPGVESNCYDESKQ